MACPMEPSSWHELGAGAITGWDQQKGAVKIDVPTTRRVLNGSYKWLIWGQDDTAFFPEGVTRALETHQLDADLPYFVSGRLCSLSSLSASRIAAWRTASTF